MRFEFATAGRILFGAGTLKEAGLLARSFGARALIVTGRHPERASGLLESLDLHGVQTTPFVVAGEPTTTAVEAGVRQARSEKCDLIIGLGGGSAIDAAKAIAALLTNTGNLHDYLEVIGRAQPLQQPSAPCIAIPTTAGTGAEVTRNSVLASPEHRVKVSLRSVGMLPRAAIIDPELTYDLPPKLTASTGLDALTQLIEPYLCNRTNPLADGLCIEGLRRAARSLRRACENGKDVSAREDMAMASLFGGLALANAGLGAVHGFAAPIGGMFPAPHGAVCAALLPEVLEANLQALQARAPGHAVLDRFEVLGRLLTGQTHASAADALAWVRALCATLEVPKLRAYGVTAGDVATVVEKAANASSMKGNPITLTPEELTTIVNAAL